MIATSLRQFLEYKHRLWVVITVTCLVLLATTWPAVDEYTATRERQESLRSSLASTQATISQLSTFESHVKEKKAVLTKLEAKVLPEQLIQQFRNDVVQMVRESGCRMRRIRLEKPREREWKKNDNPLEIRAADASGATSFMLRTQQFGLSVTGAMSDVTKLLALLKAEDHLIHCKSFSIQRSDFDGEVVVLDIELLLFDLVRKNPDETV